MAAMSKTLRISILCYSMVLWFAGIYVRGCILKLFLVRAIMTVVRNIVEGVKFTIPMMLCSVFVAVWH